MIGLTFFGVAGEHAKCEFAINELALEDCIDYNSQDIGSDLDRLAGGGIKMMIAMLHHVKSFGRWSPRERISHCSVTGNVNPPGLWTMMLIRVLAVQAS